MANEGTPFSEGTTNCIVRYFTVADGSALAKGALLQQSGDRTGITHSGSADVVPLGVIVEEKEANDGKTVIGCQRTGVATLTTSAAVVTGDTVRYGATANCIVPSGGYISSTSGRCVIGRALETVASGLPCKVALCLG